MLDERYGRHPIDRSKPPFTCGLTGAEYSVPEVRTRMDSLARSLSKELNFLPNTGTEWDKVVGIFSVNTVYFELIIRAWLACVFSLTIPLVD